MFLVFPFLLYLDPKGKNETKNGGTVTWKENLHLNVPEAGQKAHKVSYNEEAT